MPEALHIGRGGIHPGWNSEWEAFFDSPSGKAATAADIRQKLGCMKRIAKFKAVLSKGKAATVTYGKWMSPRLRGVRAATGTLSPKAVGGSKVAVALALVATLAAGGSLAEAAFDHSADTEFDNAVGAAQRFAGRNSLGNAIDYFVAMHALLLKAGYPEEGSALEMNKAIENIATQFPL